MTYRIYYFVNGGKKTQDIIIADSCSVSLGGVLVFRKDGRDIAFFKPDVCYFVAEDGE